MARGESKFNTGNLINIEEKGFDTEDKGMLSDAGKFLGRKIGSTLESAGKKIGGAAGPVIEEGPKQLELPLEMAKKPIPSWAKIGAVGAGAYGLSKLSGGETPKVAKGIKEKGIASRAALGSLAGAAVGAGTGAAASDEGHRKEGALRGAAIGGVAGGIGAGISAHERQTVRNKVHDIANFGSAAKAEDRYQTEWYKAQKKFEKSSGGKATPREYDKAKKVRDQEMDEAGDRWEPFHKHRETLHGLAKSVEKDKYRDTMGGAAFGLAGAAGRKKEEKSWKPNYGALTTGLVGGLIAGDTANRLQDRRNQKFQHEISDKIDRLDGRKKEMRGSAKFETMKMKGFTEVEDVKSVGGEGGGGKKGSSKQFDENYTMAENLNMVGGKAKRDIADSYLQDVKRENSKEPPGTPTKMAENLSEVASGAKKDIADGYVSDIQESKGLAEGIEFHQGNVNQMLNEIETKCATLDMTKPGSMAKKMGMVKEKGMPPGLGKHLAKVAAVGTATGAATGAGIGAAMAPEGHAGEGAKRGAAYGAIGGAPGGMIGGGIGGYLAGKRVRKDVEKKKSEED